MEIIACKFEKEKAVAMVRCGICRQAFEHVLKINIHTVACPVCDSFGTVPGEAHLREQHQAIKERLQA